MKLTLKVGATSLITQIFIRDSSSSTGAGLTGLVFNSAGLTAYYHKDIDTTATAITLVTMTVGTFTSSGFKEIDATNMPGWYQLCLPDAAISTGKNVGVHLKGATNMAPTPIEVQLVAYDPYDSVRLGLTALPNATPGASNGIFIAGSNATTTANITGNITGNLTGTIGGVTAAGLKNFFDTNSTTTYASAVAGSVVKEIASNAAGSAPSAATVATAVLDEIVEGSYTLRQCVRGIISSLLGKLSGAATSSVAIRDTGDTKNRVSATVDSSGNRTAVTLDLT